MTEQSLLDKLPLVIWVENTFQITGRGRVAMGVILRGTARVSIPVEVYQEGQCWPARIEGVEFIRLVGSRADERKKLGLGPLLGFLLQPEQPQIEANALILSPGTVKNNPRWAEVTNLQEVQALIRIELKDEK